MKKKIVQILHIYGFRAISTILGLIHIISLYLPIRTWIKVKGHGDHDIHHIQYLKKIVRKLLIFLELEPFYTILGPPRH